MYIPRSHPDLSHREQNVSRSAHNYILLHFCLFVFCLVLFSTTESQTISQLFHFIRKKILFADRDPLRKNKPSYIFQLYRFIVGCKIRKKKKLKNRSTTVSGR